MTMSVAEPRAVASAAGGEAGTGEHRGRDSIARQLLKPRRRAQIDIWLQETVCLWETQYCAAQGEFGHRSDSPTPQPTGQPGESPGSTAVKDDICLVCGRSSEGNLPSVQPPGKDPPRPTEGRPRRGEHMLRGIRAAVGRLRVRDRGKGGGEDDERGTGRAVVSTAMFLAEVSGDDDSSVATASSSSGRFGGGDGKAPPDERKVLEERMKRLMRAQKLLDRNQAGRR